MENTTNLTPQKSWLQQHASKLVALAFWGTTRLCLHL